MTLANLPNPPPGAHPVQLELWRRVLHRRYRQIGALSPSTFHSFASGVASDYASSLRANSQIDLSKSHYSSFLLPRPRQDGPSAMEDDDNNGDNTAQQIAFHLLALFYTAIDERISPPERQFAIDVVKRAFSLLDDELKRNDRADSNSSDGDGDYLGKHGRDEDEEDEEKEEEHMAEMPKKKHARKDYYDDTNTTGLVDSGDIQNNQAKTDEEGETVASSVPSASTSKHHESNEGAADEMQVDGNNDHQEIPTQSNETEEVTVDDVDGDKGELGASLNMSDVPQHPGDGGVNAECAEHLPNEEWGNSMEEAVAADEGVAKPAESGTMRDKPQLKEPDEEGDPNCEGENTDEVMETEAVRINEFRSSCA